MWPKMQAPDSSRALDTRTSRLPHSNCTEKSRQVVISNPRGLFAGEGSVFLILEGHSSKDNDVQNAKKPHSANPGRPNQPFGTIT